MRSYFDVDDVIQGSECPYALSPDLTGLQAGDGNRGWGWGSRMVGAALATCPCIGRQQIVKQSQPAFTSWRQTD